jgi:hypothetical protein
VHCADFHRHLGRQITRCLIAHPQADTMQLADWAYGAGPHPTWHRWNIIRHRRKWGIQPIGKRKTGKDGRPRLVWALRKSLRLRKALSATCVLSKRPRPAAAFRRSAKVVVSRKLSALLKRPRGYLITSIVFPIRSDPILCECFVSCSNIELTVADHVAN